MKTILLFLIAFSCSITAMKRSTSHLNIDESVILKLKALTPKKLDLFVKNKGGIKELDESELEGFVRNRGGYTKLNCNELNQVNLRKFILNPEWQKPFSDARTQRLRREKEKKLSVMKLWTKKQVIDYVESKPCNEKFDCDELNILNDILEKSDQVISAISKLEQNGSEDQSGLTNSKKKLLQEKFVKFKRGSKRWPEVDFSIMKEADLDEYTESFLLTSVEAEFISHRQSEIKQLEFIKDWDRERAMLFIHNLLNKESLTYEQWKKISCIIGLPLVQLKPLIKPMGKTEYQELLEKHQKEIEELKQIGTELNNSQSVLDDTAT